MEQIRGAIQQVVKDLYGTEVNVALTRPDEQFGDFAANVAMHLAKSLGRNPREVAEEIVSKLSDESISKAEVAGPGFINIRLTGQALFDLAYVKPAKTLAGKTIIVEYSDPNPFKPLHAGHLYTTLVGDTIARLIENAGAEVVRINFGGDVGLHVSKSMWAIIKHLGGDFPDKLDQIPEAERPTWMGDRYVEGNNAYEDDAAAKQEIINVNKGVYDIFKNNDHESPFAQIYWTCRQWSYDYFAILYDQLRVVSFDRYLPESEVAGLGLKTVQAHTGDVYELSNGAVIFDGEKYGLHKRVFINSEGLPTYEAKDVGLMLTKWQDYHYDRSYYITASEQAQYFQVVFKSIEQFLPEASKRAVSMTHGVVKLSGGVKMSSRKGNVLLALDILNSAREAAGDKADEGTVLAAVKYAFAKVRIGGDIIYDPTESVALEGNSGPYLQYAHARARSILARSETTNHQLPTTDYQPGERTLVRKIGEYAEVIELATTELMPHHICIYLYELAQTFNRFYEKNRVIGDPRETVRLSLVKMYAETLKDGLNILGIHAPEKM